MRLVTFASGSGGNCALVSDENGHLLIDAGISLRRITSGLRLNGLSMADISGVLITHEHGDHIRGLETLAKKCDVPVYAPRTVANHLRRMVAGIEKNLRELRLCEGERVSGFEVFCFPTPHDTPQSVGYRITGSAVLGYATDLGCVTEEVAAGLMGADAAVIEANHDIELLRCGPYPYYLKQRILSDRGHLSNLDCAALAARLADNGTRYIVLGHLSRENNEPSLARTTVAEALCGAAVGTELFVAPAESALAVEFAACSVHLKAAASG